MADNASQTETNAHPTPQRRTLGDTIRRHRERAGLSVRQLSAKTGLNHSYLSRLENGTREHPAPEVLQSIARAFDLEPAKLLRFIGIKPTDLMPSKRVFFRRAYGLTAGEAVEAEARIAEVIEELRRHTNKPDANQ